MAALVQFNGIFQGDHPGLPEKTEGCQFLGVYLQQAGFTQFPIKLKTEPVPTSCVLFNIWFPNCSERRSLKLLAPGMSYPVSGRLTSLILPSKSMRARFQPSLSYSPGLTTLPKNRMLSEALSRMKKTKGWSARKTGGIDLVLITAAVAAAASVPSSFTSAKAL